MLKLNEERAKELNEDAKLELDGNNIKKVVTKDNWTNLSSEDDVITEQNKKNLIDGIEHSNLQNKKNSIELFNTFHTVLVSSLFGLFLKPIGNEKKVLRVGRFLSLLILTIILLVFGDVELNVLFDRVPTWLVVSQHIVNISLKYFGVCLLILLAYPYTNGFREWLSKRFNK